MRIFLCLFLLFAAQLQAADLLLFYSAGCPYSRKVLRYLDSIDKTVPMKEVSRNPEAKQELLERGGMKIVPCLLIDSSPLYDANAIIEWMEHHQNLLSKKAS